MKFLPKDYDPSLIYARTSFIERTIMSLESYFMGLYPDGLSQLKDIQLKQSKKYLRPKINLTIGEEIIEKLGSNPLPYNIPVLHFNYVESSKDALLLYNNCPLASKTRQDYIKKKYAEHFSNHTATWLEITKYYKNITMNRLRSSGVAGRLCDFLLCANSDGVKPGYISDYVLKKCAEFIGESQRDGYSFYKNAITASTKPFAIEVIKWMKAVINKETKVKYAIFSAHDTTLMRLLIAFRELESSIKITELTPFASNIRFELHKNGTEFDVIVYFNDKMIYHKLYSKFKAEFEKLGDVKVSYEEACKIKSTSIHDESIPWVTSIE